MLWLPAVNLITNLTYKPRECYFNFDPAYIIMQDCIAYLLPMFVILGITIYILKVLHEANKRRKVMKRRRARIKNGQKGAVAAGSAPARLSILAQLRASLSSTTAHPASFYMREATTTDKYSNSELSFASEYASIMPDECHQLANSMNEPTSGEHLTLSAGSGNHPVHNNSRSKRPQSVSAVSLNETKQRVNVTAQRCNSAVENNKTGNLLNVSSISNDSLSRSSNSIRVVEDPQSPGGAQPKKSNIKFTVSNDSAASTNQVLLTAGNKVGRSLAELNSRKQTACSTASSGQKPGAPRIQQQISFNLKQQPCGCIKLNAYAKLYVIIATFCILWLPFCILWYKFYFQQKKNLFEAFFATI